MPRGSGAGRILQGAFGLGFLVLAGAAAARGSSPRWIAGPPFFTVAGPVVVWYTDHPLYFTDPGDLSAFVDHAAADAMVAAAAGAWNVPASRLVLQQGGTLDEPVSGANVFAGASGLVFPADVESSNYAAKQIAIIYDRDGSVTDLLLGGGGSDPSGCRQNAVTESVDAFAPAGYIQHAVLILNGRCTGAAPEQQLQMQYQLERAFGRVLGLGWSQLNDNVFTGSPQATYQQVLHWPIMHPIDVICGLYTYQCLPEPFTLRADDISSLVLLYPVTGSAGPGKQLSSSNGSVIEGSLLFPTGGGMAGVNLVMRRNSVPQQVMETWDEVSAVSGIALQQSSGNRITARPAGIAGSLGERPNYDVAGYFRFPWVPVPDGQYEQDLFIHGEPINPLYTGAYAITPYISSTVTPSGDPIAWRVNGVPAGFDGGYGEVPTNAASDCAPGPDGTESAAVPPMPGGWWTGLLCGPNGANPAYFGHSSWTALPVRANRSLTVEVTALDEQGLATANKARPVIGVLRSTDAPGSAPSVAVAPVAFNGVATGMTALTAQSAQADTFRIVIADERGEGRPDFTYRARVMYADTLAPAAGSGGAQVTISGTGFRPGNVVTVEGVAAKVASWSATTIVATVPFLKGVPPGTSVMADVAVTDLATSGSTLMSGAFQYSYTALPYTLALVSGPSGSVPVSLAASPSFVVKAIDIDGVTPLAGVPVVFGVVAGAGAVSWGGCGPVAACTVVTGADGLASVGVTPTLAGPVTLQAAALGLTQSISFQAVALVRSVVVAPPAVYVAAGATVSWNAVASVLQQGVPAALAPLTWTVGGGPMSLSGSSPLTDALGLGETTVTAGPLAGGAVATGAVCAWGGVCGSFAAVGVDPSQFVVVLMGGGGQSVPAAGALTPVSFQLTDGAGDPVVGAAVTIHQTVSQWTAPCPVQGRCPVAPVYEASESTVTSDGGGMVVVAPLEIAGAEVTAVVVTSGTQGFVSLRLQKHP